MTPVTQATIMVTGTQIKEMNVGCLTCTIIAGSFCIFPLCFMCCNWWKKMVNPAFDVPVRTYQSLQTLINCSELKSITLVVTDNLFGA
jgi:hypothetical protein